MIYMGLFGKLEENIHHGGIKVHVQAPSSVPGNQVIPVTVTIVADGSQTINSVKAEIKAQIREEGISEGFGMGGMNGMGMNRGGIGVQAGGSNYRTVAQVESREPFTISPGETKTVNFQLYLQGSGGNTNPAPGISGALGAIESVAQNFEHVNYLYRVEASANVQGVSLDPNDKQPIEILPPSETAQPGQPTPFAADPVSNQDQPPMAQPASPTPMMPPTQPPQDGLPGQQAEPQF
jgi:hypothetical protein